ncbi:MULTISPECIES: hypothetical protein [unclassified Mesorhizobium]|uniref:hypothetical protein n=1 Tax=Mesorhizobium sp. M1252 TaxID=2957073 RepID=UPI0003F51ABD|nr:hypothetical protein [Mesorhizobium sp. L2C054A000]
MKSYLCKYIPPRSDFLATMTTDEEEWMKQHGAFLDDLLEKRLIVAHGPGPGWRLWGVALSDCR